MAEAWIEVYNTDITPAGLEITLSLYGKNFRRTVFKDHTYRPAGIHVRGLGDVAKDANENTKLMVESGANLFVIPFEIKEAKPWTPEHPWLYQLQISIYTNGNLLDTQARHFGMRSFRMDVRDEKQGGFFLNNNFIPLRGANTMGHLQQCVMKGDMDQLRDDILLAKICHINFFRLTQRPVQPEIYDYCDQLGMMLQTDLPLFGVMRRPKFVEALQQVRDMERLVRSHPSNIMVTFINEPFPNAMDKPHRHLTRPELEVFFETASHIVRQQNPDRVIKPADGDYDPPGPGIPDNHCYCGWYIGHGLDIGELHKGFWQRVKPGWFYGCGEFGAEGLDPESVMRRYYPREWLPGTAEEESSWNPDDIVMAQTGRFHYLWFDTQKDITHWVGASQEHQAWVIRLMTEAFRRNSLMNSFAVHLFIDAFPAGWMKSIMDVERRPKKAFFTYMDALEPIMVNLRTDRNAFYSGEDVTIEAWVCNDAHHLPADAGLEYQLQLDESVLLHGREDVEIPEYGGRCQGVIRFKAPDVSERKALSVTLSLVSDKRSVIHDHRLTLSLFPKPEKLKVSPVRILGGKTGAARRLTENLRLESLGMATEITPDVFLIDDYDIYRRHKNIINGSVKAGGLALFLELPPGSYQIGGSDITVSACGMGQRHFVSRNTGHPVVADFAPDDFKFWYDAALDHPSPLLSTVFESDPWLPILTSGNGGWAGPWRKVNAAAEMDDGKGCWRICQVHLAGRIHGNPVARIFAERLMTYKRGDN
jgi:hypothetical protein